MKKGILIICSLVLFSCASLTLTAVPDAEFTKEKIVENLNTSKNDLYVKSNKWMVDAFNNSESVIQFSDKEAGIFTGKYLMMGDVSVGLYATTIDTRVFFTISVEVQNNRAKINIKPSKQIMANPQMKEIIINNIDNLINDFEKAMQSKKENW